MEQRHEQELAILSLPLSVQDSLRVLSELWGLINPAAGASWTEYIHRDTYRIISDFAILLPDDFETFVNDVVKGDGLQSTPCKEHEHGKTAPIRQYLHPAWGRNRFARSQLEAATTRSRSQRSQVEDGHQSGYSSSRGSMVSVSTSLTGHEAETEDELFSRTPSPSPDERAPTPISTPSSPSKRHSDTEDDDLYTPRKRSRCGTSSYSDFRDDVEEAGPESSILDTPSKAAAAVLGSLSIASQELDFSSPPGCQTTEESPLWNRVSSLPLGERMAFVLPPNAYQKTFADKDVCFHVQWELERLVARSSIITWDDFEMRDFAPLYGVGALVGVPRVHDIVANVTEKKRSGMRSGIVSRHMSKEHEIRLLAEVDREEKSIRSGRNDGLLSDDPSWPFGGKIGYTISVVPLESSQPGKGVQLRDDSPSDIEVNPTQIASEARRLQFKMELRPPTKTGKSFRLARRFGSRRILDIKYPKLRKPQDSKAMFDLFHGRTFLLFGRSYQAIWSAPDKDAVFAVEVQSTDFRHFTMAHEPSMPTFNTIMDMFNPLGQKPGQAMAKWASRPQLLFSTSLPAVRLSSSEIGVIDDIIVAGLDGPASTEQTLTDGCGFMTEALARQIGTRMQSPKGRPFVVQMRLGGAKGLLALMTEDQEKMYPGKSVLLRKSMVKSLSTSMDPSLFIIDILRSGGNMIRYGTILGPEPIVCLAHNGVPHQTIMTLAKENLEELRRDFLPSPHEGETDDDARERLVANLYRQGGVGWDRDKKRCARRGESLRVAGLLRDWSDDGDEGLIASNECEIDDELGYDCFSGQPNSLHESLMMAIESGFDPRQSAFASQKLHHFIRLKVDKVVTDYKISVARSVSAFIVPDSLEMLQPEEIFVSFSGEGPIDPTTGCATSHLLGDVLVYRSPCKLPTDIRKFRAVYRPELCHLKDCIVMSASSTACYRSPASFLSGGDYDGDTATVIYEPALVEPFHNADEAIATTPLSFEEENFEKEFVKGTDFLSELKGEGDETMVRNYQHFLLGSIQDDKTTGTYSGFHDVAVYKLGYDHPETIRLGRMFCLVLDARKSGLKLKPEVLRRDRQQYDGELPWKAVGKSDNNTDGWNRPAPVSRPQSLGLFIMDRLYASNLRHGSLIKTSFPSDVPERSRADFEALCEPFERARDRVSKISAELEHIEGLLGTLDPASQLGHFMTSILLEQRKVVHELERLEEHVTVCFEIWELTRCGMLATEKPMHQHYSDRRRGHDLARRVHDSDSSKQRIQMGALASLWHGQLKVEDLSLLCGNHLELRRLMVSCAAHQATHKDKQLFPFDMDFDTTLAMKAESRGLTRTMMKSSALTSKPIWKA